MTDITLALFIFFAVIGAGTVLVDLAILFLFLYKFWEDYKK